LITDKKTLVKDFLNRVIQLCTKNPQWIEKVKLPETSGIRSLTEELDEDIS
jgi:hypothetical protein